MKLGLRWLCAIALTGLSLDPGWLLGKSPAVATVCAVFTNFEVATLPHAHDYALDQHGCAAGKKGIRGIESNTDLSLLFTVFWPLSLRSTELKNSGLVTDLLPASRENALGALYLICGPPALG